MTYRGQVKNGVIVLDEPLTLPEGTIVKVEAAEPNADLEGLKAGLLQLAGMVKGLPSDMARNHDHYIHGTSPK